MQKLFEKIQRIAGYKIFMAENYLTPLALFAIRLYVGLVFWRSGQTKIANIDSAKQLFDFEYIPLWQENRVQNILGFDIAFPVPAAGFAAIGATTAELVFAALLILGLGARVAALGILMLAITIETFIYPNTVEHHYWMLLMSLVIATGAGKISADYFIRRKYLPDSIAACNTTEKKAS